MFGSIQTPKQRWRNVVHTILWIRHQYAGSSDLEAQAKLALLCPPSLRSQDDHEKIQRMMGRFSYFAGIKAKYGLQMFHAICEQLYLKRFGPGETIISISQEGQTFFVILSGTVGIHLYQPRYGVDKKLAQSKQRAEKQAEEDLSELFIQVEVNRLGPGESFGELSLVESGAKTTATVITKEACEFACLEKRHYWDLMGKLKQDELYEKLDFLKQLPFLEGWYDQDLKTLSYHFKSVKLKKGQTLYRRDEKAKGVYFVKQGIMQIWGVVPVESKLKFDQCEELIRDRTHSNHAKHLSTVTVGSLLGEEELLGLQVRRYTAVCGSLESELFRVNYAELERRLWFGQSKLFLQEMAQRCSQYRKCYEEKMDQMVFLKDQHQPEDVLMIQHLEKQRVKLFMRQTLGKPPVFNIHDSCQNDENKKGKNSSLIEKVEKSSVKKPPVVDFFSAGSDLGQPYSLTSRLSRNPSGQKGNSQWIHLDVFQRAKLLGLTGQRWTGLQVRTKEKEQQQEFKKSIQQLRTTFFKGNMKLKLLNDPPSAPRFVNRERQTSRHSDYKSSERPIHSKRMSVPKFSLKIDSIDFKDMIVTNTATPSLSRWHSKSQHTFCESSRPPTGKVFEKSRLLPDLK